MFDVVEPLSRIGSNEVRQREQEWFRDFDGLIQVELRDLVVSADGDTAFAFGLNRYRGDLNSGGSIDMWVRHTSCYRLKGHGWCLVHEHLSVPFDPNTGQWSADGNPSQHADQQPDSVAATSLQRICGQLSCSQLSVSEVWFEKVFGRPPDAKPMSGLVEWYHRGAAGLQLYEDRAHAGHGTLTLVVGRLSEERERLVRAGLTPGPIEVATTTTLVRMTDPDGNLIVLAQPGGRSAADARDPE